MLRIDFDSLNRFSRRFILSFKIWFFSPRLMSKDLNSNSFIFSFNSLFSLKILEFSLSSSSFSSKPLDCLRRFSSKSWVFSFSLFSNSFKFIFSWVRVLFPFFKDLAVFPNSIFASLSLLKASWMSSSSSLYSSSLLDSLTSEFFGDP